MGKLFNFCKTFGWYESTLYFASPNLNEFYIRTTLKRKMSVTLHCDVGDIKIELFCEKCPKACENFLALAASDYYNECLFHRNIKGFMVQTGDPSGTGKGGQSIWGGKFNDEINDSLKHNVRGIVSMANSGANSNQSQFLAKSLMALTHWMPLKGWKLTQNLSLSKRPN